MKNYFVAVAVLFFTCCKSKSDSANTTQKTVDSTVVTTPAKAPAYLEGVYKWSGTIKQTIPVFMWFVSRDGVLKGELTYLKTKKRLPIMVLGTISKAEITIKEFQKNGDITGLFEGRISSDGFTGTWWGMDTDEEFPFVLKAKDTLLNAIDTSFAATDIAGIYTYAYQHMGPSGGMSVDEVSGDIFSFDISCVGPYPGHNIAMVETDTLAIINNAFTYEVKDAPSCEFRVRFFEGFAVVDYVNDRYDCAFGLNATVQGIFLKGEKVKQVRRE
jgi:hypothetical protein